MFRRLTPGRYDIGVRVARMVGHLIIGGGCASNVNQREPRMAPSANEVRKHPVFAASGAGFGDLCGGGEQPQCQIMTNFTELVSVPSDRPVPFTDQLRPAAAAYLARFKGSSRDHTESDLRCFLAWCAQRGLDPLAARRPHLELYIRWMQEIRRFKPSTVSRRFSVAAGFYRTCVIDGVLEHSPAEHVRRPSVPSESPTLRFTHLQFEALLTAARQSANPCDFALVAMLGLLGLRIFEATGADIADLGEEHGHRVLRVCGKGSKVVLIPLPPAVGRVIDRAIDTRIGGPILLNSRNTRMNRHAATRRLRRLAETTGVRIIRAHPHMLRHILSALCPCCHGRHRRASGPAACGIDHLFLAAAFRGTP
jgi:integrase/recombinase XerD